MSDKLRVTPKELTRRLRRLARSREQELTQQAGRGSHVTVKLGARRTVVPQHNVDLKPGTFSAILKDLGLTREDLEK